MAASAHHLDVLSLLRLSRVGDDVRCELAGQIVALCAEIRAVAQRSVDESLRRLGTGLTAARLGYFSLGCLVATARPGDPMFPQRAAFARR